MDLESSLVELLAGRRGHFRMESGYHSEQWFELDVLFSQPERLRPFVQELGSRLAQHGIDSVCGPMTGGSKLAEMIGDALQLEYFFTEPVEVPATNGLFPVKYRLPSEAREKVRGKSIAIVDDAISAGSAVRGTHADLMTCGARPIAIGALFVFGEAGAQFAAENGLALEGLARIKFGIWKPADCPLCRVGTPIENVSDVPPS